MKKVQNQFFLFILLYTGKKGKLWIQPEFKQLHQDKLLPFYRPQYSYKE